MYISRYLLLLFLYIVWRAEGGGGLGGAEGGGGLALTGG
tara:strand:+ start:2227 stop:2343 length:117 start_codon:yes stop_codon:yes gene_type:complete